MPVELEGGCKVVTLKEGAPRREGNLLIWDHFKGALSLRVLELHGKATLRDDENDEVLYVLERNEGILIPAGTEHVIEGDLTIVSCHSEPRRRRGIRTLKSTHDRDSSRSSALGMTAMGTEPRPLPVGRGPRPEASVEASAVRLDDQPIQKTGDRWYRELIQGETTQFVGSIPPGRAPDHFHLYEEVICILDGVGRMWTGTKSTPIANGSCIFLPRKQSHCVENTGSGELRLLGVFYPAGSPAVRYPA